jgi:hypothetical protein
MGFRQLLKASNRILQDPCGNGKRMSEVVVPLVDDFRQTFPVIPKRTMADELKACLTSSGLWRYVTIFRLTTNLRVHLQGDAHVDHFAGQLFILGNRKTSADPNTGLISFPDTFSNIVDSIEAMKNSVFTNI